LKFPCLQIDGNADSHGTSAVFQAVTLLYTVFCYGEWYLAAILSLLPFSRNLMEFMLKSGVFGDYINLYVLPSI
jgi:hypothetical protein